MIAYVTNADYDTVEANQEDFAITFQSKNRLSWAAMPR